MGKRLIIKGADFSQNGIVPVANQIKGVKTADSAQYVTLGIPTGLDTSCAVELEFTITQQLVINNAYYNLGTTYTSRSYMMTTSSDDGRIRAYVNGKYAGGNVEPYTPGPSLNTKHKIFASSSKTVYDGVETATSKGTVSSAVSINGILLFVQPLGGSSIIATTAGALIIHSFKLYSSDGSTLLGNYVAAKDNNNKACFWNLVNDELFYANSGDLIAVTE